MGALDWIAERERARQAGSVEADEYAQEAPARTGAAAGNGGPPRFQATGRSRREAAVARGPLGGSAADPPSGAGSLDVAGRRVRLRLVTEPSVLGEFVQRLRAADRVGVGWHSHGASSGPSGAFPARVGFALPGGAVYVLDPIRVGWDWLQSAIGGAVWVGYDLKRLLGTVLERGGGSPGLPSCFDIMLAAQILAAGDKSIPCDLRSVVRRELGIAVPQLAPGSDGAPAASASERAALDAVFSLLLQARLHERLTAEGLTRVARLEFRTLPGVAWLERTGVPFDAQAWSALAHRNESELRRVEELLSGISDINWNSSAQVLRALREAGLPVDDTREETLRRHRHHRVVALLLDHRRLHRLHSAYGSSWCERVAPSSGRLYTDWRQIGAASGRMACRDPNLQNLPRDLAYRACIRPPEGRVLVKADYSQLELRIAADIAADQRMIEAYRKGLDLHAVTARQLTGQTSVGKEARQLAKAINFGLLYGMGPETLCRYAQSRYGVSLSLGEAKRYREAFFSAYPGLRAWHRSQRGGRVDVRTRSGRLRRGVERFTEKLNTPIQGTAADGMKLALALVWETRDACPSARPILAVHDELVVECDRSEAEQARRWVVECMRRGMSEFVQRVPVEVDAVVCQDWSGRPVESTAG